MTETVVDPKILDLADYLTQFKPVETKTLAYGTAGFRDKAKFLRQCMVRCGVLAVLFSKQTGKTVGIMITASHNKEEDNGVKLISPDGAMIDISLEKFCTDLVNSSDVATKIQKFCNQASLDMDFSSCEVFIGFDTRDSSDDFAKDIMNVVAKIGAKTFNFGAVTTPMVHFMNYYKYHNDKQPTLPVYFEYYSDRLTSFLDLIKFKQPSTTRRLIMDCAYGVGGLHAHNLKDPLLRMGVVLEVRNRPGEGPLNDGAGSDHVQSNKMLPDNVGTASVHEDPTETACCSIDGDGDRVVYYYEGDDRHVNLIDGDRMAYVILYVLLKMVNKLPVKEPMYKLRVGLVQTAYCNGAIEKFLLELPINLHLCEFKREVTRTGVKNLHHAALKYDIAVYFEANGHGTLVYSPRVEEWAKAVALSTSREYKTLISYMRIFNAAVGDAFTDVLAFEASLVYLNMNLKNINELFSYYVSQIWKVPMSRDKLNKIKPNSSHEMWLEEPEDLQAKLSRIMESTDGFSRVFIRPSGTEEILRVYAEAENQAELAEVVAKTDEVLNSTVF